MWSCVVQTCIRETASTCNALFSHYGVRIQLKMELIDVQPIQLRCCLRVHIRRPQSRSTTLFFKLYLRLINPLLVDLLLLS